MAETAEARRERTVDAQQADRQERKYYSRGDDRNEREFVADAGDSADYDDLQEYVDAQ